jgi:hypothetical protein
MRIQQLILMGIRIHNIAVLVIILHLLLAAFRIRKDPFALALLHPDTDAVKLTKIAPFLH